MDKKWGGKRAGSGRPKKLPAPKYADRRSCSFYVSESEKIFIKDMLEALRGQREFTDSEKKLSFARMIEICRSAQFNKEKLS